MIMTENQRYWTALLASLVVALLASSAPESRMPIDFIISRSIPFALAWALLFGFSVGRHGNRGLWLPAGAPMAPHWPIWLLANHFPPPTTQATAYSLKLMYFFGAAYY